MAAKTPFRRRTHAPSLPSPAKKAKITAIHYEECRSGDSATKLILCDKGFHLFCLRPILACVPTGDWFCPSCSREKKTPKQFPLVQTKIVDFFRIQRSSGLEKLGCRKRKRRQVSILGTKKKHKLQPFNPSEDPNQRLEQMASLATALTTVGAKFCDQLVYSPDLAPRVANRSTLENRGMQVLSREDIETFNQCKRMMERGECPPLLVVFDSLEGFTVQADRFIKDLTIITEYVGEVDYLKNRESDDGGSRMEMMEKL